MPLKIKLEVKELVSELFLATQHLFEYLHQVPMILASEILFALLSALNLVDLLLTLVNIGNRFDSCLFEKVLRIFAVDLAFLVYKFIYFLINVLEFQCFLIK